MPQLSRPFPFGIEHDPAKWLPFCKCSSTICVYSLRDIAVRFLRHRFRQVIMPSHRAAVFLLATLVSTVGLLSSGVRAQTTVTSERPATFTLANGLQVVVIPDHRTPVVTQMIWYKVGSADETPGKSGLAAFSS